MHISKEQWEVWTISRQELTIYRLYFREYRTN